MEGRLAALLEVCQETGRPIALSPVNELMETLELDDLAAADRFVYLLDFAPMRLPERARRTVAENLFHCVEVPPRLSEAQKGVLMEPFVSACSLFGSAPFEEVWQLLDAGPVLADIARLLAEKQVTEELGLTEYRIFAADAPEYLRGVKAVMERMDADTAGFFLDFWKRNGCPLRELRTMERRIAAHADADLPRTLSTYSGYVNLLYGDPFRSVQLSNARPWQEDLLIYAIVRRKKGFIRLVDHDPEAFLSLPHDSLLFSRPLYEEHLNINDLTLRDLADFAWMRAGRLTLDALAPGRCYTFPELKTLYNAGGPYVPLYDRLTGEKQDYRLKVLRQLVKRDLLPEGLGGEELDALADGLNMKPLYDWMSADFAHIEGLTAGDAVRLLIHLDAVWRLLPSMRTRTDALLALRDLEVLRGFDTMDALKADIVTMDKDWSALAKDMELSRDFLERNGDNIVEFLCRDGAYISRTYAGCLRKQQKTAFYRVVKAELMGRLPALKYFEGDLQKELDLPVPALVRTRWPENTAMEKDGMEAREYDDFFSTMLLGTQPQRTCLCYTDGAYRECLLAGFDSNKKVLYAKRGEKILGRACLRLTKGCLKNQTGGGQEDGFSFVDLENVAATRREDPRDGERAVLFLERPYISGAKPEDQRRIVDLFVELARRKAEAMGVMLVTSMNYQETDVPNMAQTRLALYISKTKAGSQYLDSMGGQATVNTEGSYQSNRFLIWGTESIDAA